MADINQVVLIGRLTRDSELKYTNSGYPILSMSIAVNRSVKKDDTWQEEASFFDAVLYGKRGEAIQQYLLKGKQIGIQGELRQDRWQQPDGQKRSKVEIVINELQFVGGRPGGASGQGGDYSSEEGVETAPRAKSGPRPAQGGTQSGPAGDDFEDDIPF